MRDPRALLVCTVTNVMPMPSTQAQNQNYARPPQETEEKIPRQLRRSVGESDPAESVAAARRTQGSVPRARTSPASQSAANRRVLPGFSSLRSVIRARTRVPRRLPRSGYYSQGIRSAHYAEILASATKYEDTHSESSQVQLEKSDAYITLARFRTRCGRPFIWLKPKKAVQCHVTVKRERNVLPTAAEGVAFVAQR